MTVDDFGTTLAHLMRVCWSASAGQLHLASVGDVEPVSSSQHLSPSPAHPVGGGEEERGGQLCAGVCVKQLDGMVSSKVKGHLYS